MASAPTIYQKKQAARRATADIERLAKTYQSGLFDTVQQQQNAFVGWQAESDRVMKPYEASVKQYTDVAFPAYQAEMAKYNATIAAYDQQVAAYRQRLNAYQSTLAQVEANPLEQVSATTINYGRGSVGYNIGGQVIHQANLANAGYILDGGVVYRERSIPTFSEAPPPPPSVTAPVAPTPPGAPPSVPAFDNTPFAAKRDELGKTFEREVGERKAAKQNVVMRRMGRGMLQGA